jgi:hypothetical protein
MVIIRECLLDSMVFVLLFPPMINLKAKKGRPPSF